jgi:hypothetical protein
VKVLDLNISKDLRSSKKEFDGSGFLVKAIPIDIETRDEI